MPRNSTANAGNSPESGTFLANSPPKMAGKAIFTDQQFSTDKRLGAEKGCATEYRRLGTRGSAYRLDFEFGVEFTTC
ncbi:hypothetical protein [Microbulbifer agarilyticus]|uniref:hypothetical protein n=1 Tax=Microbulbifer agarilyticus TaxID=260552 RepID=UPI001CD6BD9C|nr:hypothetical protein [Microbulbifer agarilyticus]MCA0894143.1 hypothetical protein [Microbulbifer agarilyticus]